MVDAVPLFQELIQPVTTAADGVNNLGNTVTQGLNDHGNTVTQGLHAVVVEQHRQTWARISDIDGQLANLQREVRSLEVRIGEHWREVERVVVVLREFDAQHAALRDEFEAFRRRPPRRQPQP